MEQGEFATSCLRNGNNLGPLCRLGGIAFAIGLKRKLGFENITVNSILIFILVQSPDIYGVLRFTKKQGILEEPGE